MPPLPTAAPKPPPLPPQKGPPKLPSWFGTMRRLGRERHTLPPARPRRLPPPPRLPSKIDLVRKALGLPPKLPRASSAPLTSPVALPKPIGAEPRQEASRPLRDKIDELLDRFDTLTEIMKKEQHVGKAVGQASRHSVGGMPVPGLGPGSIAGGVRVFRP